MRTITRKTNVRRHDRHLPSKVADVRKHQRTVTRQMLGTIPVRDLTYPQARRVFRGLPAYEDWDGDGVPNKRDCRPFDEELQHTPGSRPVAGFKIQHQIPEHTLKGNLSFDKNLSMEPFKKMPGEHIPTFLEKEEEKEKKSSKTPSWVFAKRKILEKMKKENKTYEEVMEEQRMKKNRESRSFMGIDLDEDEDERIANLLEQADLKKQQEKEEMDELYDEDSSYL